MVTNSNLEAALVTFCLKIINFWFDQQAGKAHTIDLTYLVHNNSSRWRQVCMVIGRTPWWDTKLIQRIQMEYKYRAKFRVGLLYKMIASNCLFEFHTKRITICEKEQFNIRTETWCCTACATYVLQRHVTETTGVLYMAYNTEGLFKETWENFNPSAAAGI
jgi:hypothetical protein